MQAETEAEQTAGSSTYKPAASSWRTSIAPFFQDHLPAFFPLFKVFLNIFFFQISDFCKKPFILAKTYHSLLYLCEHLLVFLEFVPLFLNFCLRSFAYELLVCKHSFRTFDLFVQSLFFLCKSLFFLLEIHKILKRQIYDRIRNYDGYRIVLYPSFVLCTMMSDANISGITDCLNPSIAFVSSSFR